jgi:Domain of unknown function (DUF6894)
LRLSISARVCYELKISREQHMPLYYFNLNTGRKSIIDLEGTDLSDEAAARSHGQTVAREIMRNDRNRTLSWRLEVSDEQRQPCFELLLATVCEELQYYPHSVREAVTQNASRVAGLNDDIAELRHSMLKVRATLARVDRMPYLAAVNGRRINGGGGDR